MRKIFLTFLVVILLLPQVGFAALTDSLVSYWKLDESSGNAADSVSSNTLTNENGGGGSITYTPVLINNGAENDGGASRLRNAALAGLTAASTNTWNIWGNADSFGGYWIDHLPESGSKRLLLYGNGTGFTMFASGNEVSSGALSTATDYMLTITKSGTTWEFFVNGTSKGTVSSGAANYSNIQDISFLNPADSYGAPVDGRIDEAAYWTRVLTTDEITELYNSGAGFQYPFVAAEESTEDIIWFFF